MNFQKIIFAGIFITGITMPPLAQGASFFITPPKKEYDIDAQKIATIAINSKNENINAISALITFPKEKLEILSLSKENSIIKFWPQEPYFSNENGTIMLEGIVPSPGFQGEFGNIIDIKFRGKSEGSAKINFINASILLNDGQGTNVVEGINGATYKFTPKKEIIPPPPTIKQEEMETPPPKEPLTEKEASSPILKFEEKKENLINNIFLLQYPKEIILPYPIIVKGKTKFPTELKITIDEIKEDEDSQVIKKIETLLTDENGNFTFVSENNSPGLYVGIIEINKKEEKGASQMFSFEIKNKIVGKVSQKSIPNLYPYIIIGLILETIILLILQKEKYEKKLLTKKKRK